ncbi:MAG: DUF2807 domain-containing protein [Deltaproteobacteria bacterium]|nr:DUF2807 domain-containing protein [Deltaproteobacteria bacterium]
MRTRTPAALLLAAALASPAAARAHEAPLAGDGAKVTQRREVPAFLRIELRGPLDVRVTEGQAPSVAVTIDHNLQPLVTTEVKGDTLVVDTERGMHFRGPGEVVVTLPELRGLAIEGSGDARVRGAEAGRDVKLEISGSGDIAWSGQAGKVAVRIEGSGNVALEGKAGELEARVDGSGDVSGKALRVKSARLSINGSGDVSATLDGGDLRAEVNGSGDIVWYGSATTSSLQASGSGTVSHRP